MLTTISQWPQESFWDRIANRYAKKPIADVAAYEAKLARIATLLKPDDKMLEIGCGTGSTALRLAPALAQVTATDISRRMIEIAEDKRLAAGVANAKFARLEAAERVPGAPFDVITAFSLLHLVDDLPAVLSAVHAQLKPGGLFLSKTVCLNDGNPGLRFLVRAMHALGLAPRVTPLSQSALNRALTHAGFEILECRHFGKSRMNPFLVARRRD